MEDEFGFHRQSDCELVDSILQDGLVVESDNLGSYFLWVAKSHASICDSCKQALPRLTDMIATAEKALSLEIDKIRGEHMSEASEIARRKILSPPVESEFPGDEVHSEDQTALDLMKSLAGAGRRVKNVFAAVHGEGLVWFNVVPELAHSEQEFARLECAGLIRRLSPESREFSFSASLAAELFPHLTSAVSELDPPQVPDPTLAVPESETPQGVSLGVLYKVVLAAARGYVETYLQSVEEPVLQSFNPHLRSPFEVTAPTLSRTPEMENNAEKLDSVYDAQNIMLGQQSEVMDRIRAIEARLEAQPNAIDAEWDVVWREALGSRFDELTEETRRCLRQSEKHYRNADFTDNVIWLTKAFENEFRWRVVGPLIEDLNPIAITDTTFRGDLSVLPLGGFLALFRKYTLRTEPLFERLGLEQKNVCAAISRVNKEKGAKHTSFANESQAVEFRATFLGRESVFKALFPGRTQ